MDRNLTQTMSIKRSIVTLALALVSISYKRGVGQETNLQSAAPKTTIEYSTSSFPYFSFAELKSLSISNANHPDEVIPPQLSSKLDQVLGGVIVFRSANTTPRLPKSRNVGPVLRAAEWNIERGEHFEQVADTLANSPELSLAVASKAAAAKKMKDRKRLSTRLTAEAALLADSDILVLNEVDLGVTRSAYHDVSADLARRLNMNYIYGVEFVEVDPLKLGIETLSKQDVADDEALQKQLNDELKPDPNRYKGLHGSAVLTRLPIESAEMLRLPPCYDWFSKEVAKTAAIEEGKRYASEKIFLEKISREVRRGGRMALLVRLKLSASPTGYITVLNTHLEDKTKPDCRRRQMQSILERLQSVTDPIILSGDFNTTGMDGNQLSVKYIVTSKVTDYRFWIHQSLMYATPIPALHLTKYFKSYTDPTTRDIKFLLDNKEAALFNDAQHRRFNDGEHFDFTGTKNRSVNGRRKRLANSNERARKGFAYTFALPRDFKGVVGRSKLDWFFVKPVTCSPFVRTQSNSFRTAKEDAAKNREVFIPHFGRTMMELNRVFPEQSSDHAPILVDLRLSMQKSQGQCTTSE
jgi:endonuclease/exonuclease/phosphatase family metal-dependent hydrolase